MPREIGEIISLTQSIILARQLDIVQQSIVSNKSFQAEVSLKQDLAELFLQEETLWKNKYREAWLTCNDLNTKLFHTSTLIKRRRNNISSLKLPYGAWTSDRATIGSCFTNHFSSLFSTSSLVINDDLLNLFDSFISTIENLALCAIPSEYEIFTTLSSIGSTKALKLNAFTTLFYKKYWDIVKHVVLQCV
jgi:hypothetical protein